MKRPARISAPLSDSLHRQLNGYALSACAAGVGALALAQSAGARIVYTPTNVTISRSHPVSYLNLNHERTRDFGIYYHDSSQNQFASLAVLPLAQKNKIWTGRYQTGSARSVWASPLRAGARIGDNSQHLKPGLQGMESLRFCTATNGCYIFGPWRDTTNHYLGLQFQIQGRIHYGWARLNVKVSKGSSCAPSPVCIIGTLTGYAYETISNKPIIAGRTKGSDVVTVQPATLGHLAAGASAIPASRSSQSVAPRH